MAAAIVVATNSCTSHDLFDEEKTQEISDSLSPVDSLDKYHNWVLTSTRNITVETSADVNAQWLKILTADPRQSEEAEVASQVMITEGQESYNMSFCFPSLVTTLYAALIDEQGLYTVTAFSISDTPMVAPATPPEKFPSSMKTVLSSTTWKQLPSGSNR